MYKAIDFLKLCLPCEDQYIVLPEIQEKENEYGVVFADDNKSEERTQRGEIVARGLGRLPENGTEYQPMQFNVGDKIVFKKFAGDDMYYDEDLNLLPGHHEMREGLLYVKVIRQASILFTYPHSNETA